MSEAIGALIAKMSDIREQRRELAKEDKALAEEYSNVEQSLIAALDSVGVASSASDVAIATITETAIADVQDWDKFHQWMRRTNRLFMLERRPAQAAFREYLETSRGHAPPPGVVKFVKRTISLRNKRTK